VAVPRTARQFIELLPIAFVPRVHRSSSSPLLDAAKACRVSSYPPPHPFDRLHQNMVRTVLLIVSRQERAKEILRLMFQTRQLVRSCHRFVFQNKSRAKSPKTGRVVLSRRFIGSIRRDSTC
jgi:hypothetical protein